MLIDLTGKRFGELIVLRRAPNNPKRGSAQWLCECSCGAIISVDGYKLRTGKSLSCGCKKGPLISSRKIVHGDSKRGNVSSLYKKWNSMKRRCLNPNESNYDRYGGRGITICKEWTESYEAFREWALQSGYAEGLSLDRIDCNGPYCPENCRWVPLSDQASNTRKNIYATINGQTKTVKEWARVYGIKYETLRYRLQHGTPIERAVQKGTMK